MKKQSSYLKMQKAKDTGITLIALVVTIIVLLILAGVTIGMATSNDGIIKRASNAANTYELAKEKEDEAIDSWTKKIDEVQSRQVKANVYSTSEAKKSGKTDAVVTIPDNCHIVEENGNKLDVIKDGVVIEDSNGNQWVWVPVSDSNPFKRRTDADGWTVEVDYDGKPAEEDNKDPAIRDELTLTDADVTYTDNDKNYGINENTSKEIVTQINNEKASVAKYGGFYIGRYETGIVSGSDTTPRIKQGLEPYTGSTYNQIVRWQDAYRLAKSIGGIAGGTTYLCSSYAWDTAINFIQTNSSYTNYATSIDNMNENWYSREVKDASGNVIKPANTSQRLKTGLTTPKCNIYDMGGNVAEFTTELKPGTSESVVLRGGYWGNSYMSAGHRFDTSPGSYYDSVGFRATLFL